MGVCQRYIFNSMKKVNYIFVLYNFGEVHIINKNYMINSELVYINDIVTADADGPLWRKSDETVSAL